MSYAQKDFRANPAAGAGPYMGVARCSELMKDRVQQFLDYFDAENECPHGNLPGRPQNVKRCRCFKDPAKPAKSEAA